MAALDVIRSLVDAAGKGALFNRNVETLGPDFQARIEQIKAQREAQRRAGEVHTRQLGSMDRKAFDEQATIDAEVERAGGDRAAVPGFRAAQAEDAADRERAKSEADLAHTQADTARLSAVPSQKEQELQLRAQQIEAALQRAQTAEQMAGLRATMMQTQLEIAKTREERLRGQFEDKPQIDPSTRERLVGTASVLSQLTGIEKLLKDPAAANVLGPISGRAAVKDLSALGGSITDTKSKELIVRLQGALSDEAFANGGKQLTGVELERFQQTEIRPEDTLDTAFMKLRVRREILSGKMNRVYAILSPVARRQADDLFRMEGLTGPQDPDGMPSAPAQPGAAGPPKRYKYQGQEVSFEQLPPDIQAKVKARGL
jgi:hypothetical protein